MMHNKTNLIEILYVLRESSVLSEKIVSLTYFLISTHDYVLHKLNTLCDFLRLYV